MAGGASSERIPKSLSASVLAVARSERVRPGVLRRLLRTGQVVVLGSRGHRVRAVAVGAGMRVKVNANIGTSPMRCVLKEELEKLRNAVEAGADTVMDLSVGDGVDETRRAILAESSVPVGTVPVYQVAIDARKRRRSFVDAVPKDFLAAVESHLVDGVDFITVHCGVTRRNLARLANSGRVGGVVSRGGSMLLEWMARNQKENPLYEHYDELLAMAKHHRACLSLGDGLRPGALADATDVPQVSELLTIGELVLRARAAGVQVMVEGPGHVPLDQIEANVRLEKTVCDGAPFYVLGPLVTDVACGHDHISSAIGGALAAFYGADFLCYVTRSEHLGLPGVDDVREGVIAARIAAHAADLARHHPGAMAWDRRVSSSRARLDWERMIRRSIDPLGARAVHDRYGLRLLDGRQAAGRIDPSSESDFHQRRPNRSPVGRPASGSVCSMCGEFCAVKRTAEMARRTGIRSPRFRTGTAYVSSNQKSKRARRPDGGVHMGPKSRRKPDSGSGRA